MPSDPATPTTPPAAEPPAPAGDYAGPDAPRYPGIQDSGLRTQDSHHPPAFTDACAAIAASLSGKSPHTLHTYDTGLDRFAEYLVSRDLGPETPTAALPADVLEGYYTWLVQRYGRAARTTHTTYLAGVRAFLRFLE